MRTILQKILLLIVLLVIPWNNIHAEGNNTNMTINDIVSAFDYKEVKTRNKNVITHNEHALRLKMMEDNRFFVILLAIMFLVSLITTLLLSSSSRTSKDIVTITGLNLVVFGSMISVLIVDTTEALGAIMGILGSIGGYLFGSWDKREKE